MNGRPKMIARPWGIGWADVRDADNSGGYLVSIEVAQTMVDAGLAEWARGEP